jgi:hypothetical protein
MKVRIYYPLNKYGDPSRAVPPLEFEIQHVFSSDEGLVVLGENNKRTEPSYYGLVDFEDFIGFYPVFNPPTSLDTGRIKSAPLGTTIKLITKYNEESMPVTTEFEKVDPNDLYEFIQNKSYIHVMKDIRKQRFIIKDSK